MARPEGFEPPAPRFVVWCSIQLSYGRAGGGDIGGRAEPRNPRSRRRRPVLPGRGGRAIGRAMNARVPLLAAFSCACCAAAWRRAPSPRLRRGRARGWRSRSRCARRPWSPTIPPCRPGSRRCVGEARQGERSFDARLSRAAARAAPRAGRGRLGQLGRGAAGDLAARSGARPQTAGAAAELHQLALERAGHADQRRRPARARRGDRRGRAASPPASRRGSTALRALADRRGVALRQRDIMGDAERACRPGPPRSGRGHIWPGRPAQSWPEGMRLPGVSIAPAASIASPSISQPSMTIAPRPTKARS